ncbi:hypothetical protein GALMADRAFT_238568 [Galerina marginata CBS 339.88]|uniref:Uncharacterized protein n=1 Tax=Galerina marginata (strain CBS 339.88) TaxID=685588 RepID=A0A067TI77_GALM3|nr:hypothetical protein GALMADRAFT_238568 [Galerina marginata CBS 339.88]
MSLVRTQLLNFLCTSYLPYSPSYVLTTPHRRSHPPGLGSITRGTSQCPRECLRDRNDRSHKSLPLSQTLPPPSSSPIITLISIDANPNTYQVTETTFPERTEQLHQDESFLITYMGVALLDSMRSNLSLSLLYNQFRASHPRTSRSPTSYPPSAPSPIQAASSHAHPTNSEMLYHPQPAYLHGSWH